MPGTTATQGLTYPVQTDILKEMPAHLKTLAEQLDGKLLSHQSDLDRSTYPPIVILDQTAITSYSPNTAAQYGVQFDTVQIDTPGWSDLSKNNRVIPIKRPGYYCVGAYVYVGALGVMGREARLNLRGGPTGIGQTLVSSGRDNGASAAFMSRSAVQFFVDDTSEMRIDVQADATTPPLVVAFARLWAYWVRDA